MQSADPLFSGGRAPYAKDIGEEQPDRAAEDGLMSLEDSTILQKVRDGNADAMAELIEKYRPQLLGYINKNLSDALKRKVEAEDVLQEVSMHAVRAVGEVDIDADCFGWLCQVAQRRIIDAHRRHFAAQKRSAEREVPLQGGSEGGGRGVIDLLVATMTTPSEAFSRNIKMNRMHQAIAQLPEETQTALRMRYVEGLPTKEIAEKLGKTDGAIRVLLSRSVVKLQEMLAAGE